MIPDHALVQALGAAGEDVVFLQGFQHAAAHDQQIAAEIDQEQRCQRQHHVVQDIGGFQPEAGLRVQPHVLGDHARDRKPAELVGKEPDEKEPQPGQEHRVGDQSAHRHEVVRDPPLVPGRDLAQKHAEKGGQDDGAGEQQDRVGEPFADDVDHRLAVVERVPEVPLEKIAQVVEVLEPDGAVQPQPLDQQLGVLRRHGGVHHSFDRVTGGQAEHHEQHRQDQEEHDPDLQEPAPDVTPEFHRPPPQPTSAAGN